MKDMFERNIKVNDVLFFTERPDNKDGDSICFVYEKENKLFVAFKYYKEDGKLILDGPRGHDLELIDYMYDLETKKHVGFCKHLNLLPYMRPDQVTEKFANNYFEFIDNLGD